MVKVIATMSTGFDHIALKAYKARNTRESLERILITIAENLKAYFGGNPQDIVSGIK